MTKQNTTYHPLGDYIRPVDVRNRDLKVTTLVGLTIEKAFIPSVANIIGTDLSNYKIIRRNQFACSLMQVSRDGKIPVAMFTEKEAIMSPAYPMFEVTDTSLLLPEYLMMWFSRPEFDREASYYAVGGVRGSLTWEDFCAMRIPVPPIAEQRAIVAEYEAVQNRIKVAKRMIATLQATAQALYRKMFVDGIDKENLPEGWRWGTLGEVCECFDSKRKPLANYERCSMEKKYPYYGAACLMDYVDNYLFDGCYILMGEDGTVIKDDNTPILQYVTGKFWVNNHAHVLKGANGFDENLLYMVLCNTNIAQIVTGGVQAKINQANMMSIAVLIPNTMGLSAIKKQLAPLFQNIVLFEKEIEKLTEIQTIILSGMGR